MISWWFAHIKTLDNDSDRDVSAKKKPSVPVEPHWTIKNIWHQDGIQESRLRYPRCFFWGHFCLSPWHGVVVCWLVNPKKPTESFWNDHPKKAPRLFARWRLIYGSKPQKTPRKFHMLMENILHLLMGSLSQYLKGFLQPSYFRIYSINSSS